MDLSSKHVLVTGAGKRLGRAISEELLRHGVKLTAHYGKSHREAEELVAMAKGQKSQAHAVGADLKDPAAIRKLVKTAEEKFGPVEILIHSASIFYPTPLESATESQWDELMDVNLKAAFLLSQACAKSLEAKQLPGVFLHLVDSTIRRSARRFTPYLVSKAGLAMLTRNLAQELSPRIRVNSISPGPVLEPENYTEEQKTRSAERTLLKRWGKPADIVQAVLFLIGNDYITGEDLAVDGGRSLA